MLKCEKCNTDHEGIYGSGRFCCGACARGFSTAHRRAEINAKVSATNKARGITFTKRGRGWADPEVQGHARKIQNEKFLSPLKTRPFEALSKKYRYLYLHKKQGGLCAICGLGEQWNNLPLHLHLDHVNGDNQNNHEENNRLICPNCHSQTETYCGRNKVLKRLQQS